MRTVENRISVVWAKLKWHEHYKKMAYIGVDGRFPILRLEFVVLNYTSGLQKYSAMAEPF